MMLLYNLESLSLKPMHGNGVVYLTVLAPFDQITPSVTRIGITKKGPRRRQEAHRISLGATMKCIIPCKTRQRQFPSMQLHMALAIAFRQIPNNRRPPCGHFEDGMRFP